MPLAQALSFGLHQAGELCRFRNETRLNSARLASAWGQQPYGTVIRERADGIHQAVHEVAVFLAPPKKDYIAQLIILLFEEILTEYGFDRFRDCGVTILVPTKL